MSSDRLHATSQRLGRAGLSVCALCALLIHGASCGQKRLPQESSKPAVTRSQAEAEYRHLRSEIALASGDSLYLVLDFPRQQAALKLRGTPLWSCPMRLSNGGAGVRGFVRRFAGDDNRLIRALVRKHLYGGQETIPAQTLEIVGKALKTDPAPLQRILPERFLLSFGERVFMDIRTDVEGRRIGGLENPSRSVGRALDIMMGGASLDLSMTGKEGLTMYEAIYPGMRVLLIPPASP